MPPIHIQAGTGRALTLRRDQTRRIVNVEGGQVADFIAFNAADLTEALSTIHTLVSIGRLFPTAESSSTARWPGRATRSTCGR
jgi:uncharacterized protein YcgI (DUF1989 family)